MTGRGRLVGSGDPDGDDSDEPGEIRIPLPVAGSEHDTVFLDAVLRHLAEREPRRIQQGIHFNNKTGDFFVTLWSGFLGPREGVAVSQCDIEAYREIASARSRFDRATLEAVTGRTGSGGHEERALWPTVLRVAYAKIMGKWPAGDLFRAREPAEGE